MQFAETMGLDYDDINSLVGDTDTIGFTGNTGGSRTTFATGWAVHQAALDVRAQLEERVARIWECAPDEVTYDPADTSLHGPDGKVARRTQPKRRASPRTTGWASASQKTNSLAPA